MRQSSARRWAWLLILGMLVTPSVARGQALETVPTSLPIPLGGVRPEDGGFYVAGEFLFFRQTNPMERQQVAVRGFFDVDGSNLGGLPGSFVGSARPALSTNQVGGPVTRQPGLALSAGWRFRDGTLLELTWWHLTDARYSATASIIDQNFNVGGSLADTFITAPVFNFPINYAGPATQTNTGNPGSTFGIWNASNTQTIDFVQRFDQGMINLRVPIDDAGAWRMYGILGGRAVIMWERFRWRTIAADINGTTAADDVAIYSNVVSNRWYGATLGVGGDWYLGSSPLGALAVSCEVHGSVGVDIVKERAKYELADFSTAASRAHNEYTVSPLVQGDVSLWWYPTQGIQCRVGWNILAIFNTVSSPRPIDFNVGAVAPEWETGTLRIFRGLHAGIGFIF